MKLQIKRLYPDAELPRYMTQGAAAMDLAAHLSEPVTLPPHTPVMIPLGIAVAIPEGYVGLLFGRSGLGAKQGICPSNAVGVIDSDYRGEVKASLINHTDRPAVIEPGQRVAQLVIVPCIQMETEECDTLPETARGTGGYGSTGQ